MRSKNYFEGFKLKKIKVNNIHINFRIGGVGPPVLLLHGYPQTHIMWRKIANKLSSNYTVICSDLRGYGDSDKPNSNKNHFPYSKKIMASDQIKLMDKLGFKKFNLIGHDRGARVSHRMCINNNNIIKCIVLDIVPTNVVFEKTEQYLARKYYHWFFLSQKFPLPEKLIGSDPEYYLRTKLKMWGRTSNFIDNKTMKEYIRCFSDKKTIHASCEDYRAAASIDLIDHDKDKKFKIKCPLLVLWGKKGTVDKLYNPIEEWKDWATNVTGHSINCGHFIPEEKPVKLLSAIKKFL